MKTYFLHFEHDWNQVVAYSFIRGNKVFGYKHNISTSLIITFTNHKNVVFENNLYFRSLHFMKITQVCVMVLQIWSKNIKYNVS